MSRLIPALLLILGGVTLLFGGSDGFSFPMPNPFPSPDVDGPLWLIVVEESSDRGAAMVDIARDGAWQDSLVARDIRLRIYDVDNPAADEKGFSAMANSVGLPAMIVTDVGGKVLIEESLPGDSDAVDERLGRLGR